MDIRISRKSEVPIHEQVAAQIVFLIGTGRWKPGVDLPSVRALSQRLGVHRNTITQAYDDLILRLLVEKRAGRRLTIRGGEPKPFPRNRDLQDLLNTMIGEAGRLGYSLHQLHRGLSDRLQAAPPDRLLVVSADKGMGALYRIELEQHFRCPVEVCAPDELVASPEKAMGAMVVTPPGHLPKIRSALAPGHIPVPITYSGADSVIEGIRRMEKPSLIAIASISKYFLETARGVLAEAVGDRHSIRTYMLKGDRPSIPGAADLAVCDCITYPLVCPRYKRGVAYEYRLISEASLQRISSLLPRNS